MTGSMISGLKRRRAASALLVFLAVLTAPASAVTATQQPDGSYVYFFAAPSLRIESSGDIDLGGLSFIEGVADGFRVGASFLLEWLGGENARLGSRGVYWSGFSSEPRRIEISAGNDLLLGNASLSLPEGTILLAAVGSKNLDGIATNRGGAIVLVGRDVRIDPGLQRPITNGNGSLILEPGGSISLLAPSPIPEPSTWLQLLAGLAAILTLARRSRTR